MNKVKTTRERPAVPAAEWVLRLAEETATFEVVNSAEETVRRADQRIVDQVITLSLKPDDRRVDLLVETRQQLLPNTVLGLFPKLKRNRPDGVLLLCVPYISPRVAELCREQKVSYLDGVGNCWIVAPGLFVHVVGRPNRPTVSKAVDPFSRKSSRIARTILTHPHKGWQVQQLAQQSSRRCCE